MPKLTDDMRRLIRLGIPGVIAGGITQVNILIGTIIASLQDSAVSWLYYADRIYQLPLGIVGIAIGVVLLPELSKQLRAGEDDGVRASMNRSLEFSLLLTLPAAAALLVVPGPIIQVLFERGAFTSADTPATAQALAAFAVGLPAFVLIKVFSPAFFAREDTRTPMIYAGVSVIVNVLGAWRYSSSLVMWASRWPHRLPVGSMRACWSVRCAGEAALPRTSKCAAGLVRCLRHAQSWQVFSGPRRRGSKAGSHPPMACWRRGSGSAFWCWAGSSSMGRPAN